jgi:predicted amidophosphoribosyltransferase
MIKAVTFGKLRKFVACPQCGAANPQGKYNCPNCGAIAPPPEEHKFAAKEIPLAEALTLIGHKSNG